MSAPAALAIAKVMYPETKKTKADWTTIKNLPKRLVCSSKFVSIYCNLVFFSEATNVFEVISTGAVSILKCAAAIISTVLAFVAIFNFIDAIIAWFLGMLDIQNAGLSVS
jgi:nucleoside permease NupC